MAKLPQDRVAGADEQDDAEFQPLPGQRYVYKLVEVDDSEVTGENSKNPGTPKWIWKLQVDTDYHPELRKGRWQTRLMEHIPLQPNMDWKMKQLFSGFGYTPDSDTDEIIEDPDARTVAYVFTDKSGVDKGYEPQTRAKRYVAFDPSKWEKSAPAEDDDTEF